MFRQKRRKFMSLSRKKRRQLIFELRTRIRQEASYNGGRFASHQVIEDPDLPENYTQWADFHFLSRDKFVCWNAELLTAKAAFWDAVENVAWDKAYAALGDDIREPKMEFRPASRSPSGEILSWEWIEKEPVRYDQFEGRTLQEEINRLAAAIVREEPPTIYEQFELNHTYAFGIGLHIVADVDVVDRATIEASIDRFMELGEVEWRSSIPVPRDRLPMLSMTEARERGEYTSAMFGSAVRMPLE